MNDIRAAIKQELKDGGMSKAELARRADINLYTLCNFLLSNTSMSLGKIEKIMDVLNLQVVKRYE